MILTTSILTERLKKYGDPAGKIMRMKNRGEIFPLTRGIYETDENTPGYRLAEIICSPSYLSFEYALSEYGLIPEAVYTFTSASYKKKKKKSYSNHFGNFSYRDVPSGAYPFGIVIKEEKGYFYKIASPEKALCDKLYIMPPVTSRRDIEKTLFEDLRIDSEEFKKLDADSMISIGGKYNCSNLKYFINYLRRKNT